MIIVKNLFFYETDIGRVGIAACEDKITNLYIQEDQICEDAVIFESEVIKKASRQLKGYLSGRQKSFSVPLAPTGTEFMRSVWDSLQSIPYGETRTYKEIARQIGNEKASRAVGLANHRNPIPIIIPCHRVIGSNGKMIGYRGGLKIKSYLLEMERDNTSPT